MSVLYPALRRLLFLLPPERAHHLVLSTLSKAEIIGLVRFFMRRRIQQQPLEVMGLRFNNPVGLAAGLDKDGAHIDALAALGFGFIEIGTVTPRPQMGNPQPRLFRLVPQRALINRMGFNSQGVATVVHNLKHTFYRGVLGINIGKNADTPIGRAADDYVECLRQLYPYASYFTINISSPNTADLRSLQQESELDDLLSVLEREQAALDREWGTHVPLAVKIAPDLSESELDTIAAVCSRHRVEAIIATNTTTSRVGIESAPYANEAGGLSGAPLASRSDAVLHHLARQLGGRITLIGVGGIMSAADAKAKFEAGASLVQIYSGLIYEGPSLVRNICRTLAGAQPGEMPDEDRGSARNQAA